MACWTADATVNAAIVLHRPPPATARTHPCSRRRQIRTAETAR